jgi:hypothetical protein
MTQHGGHANLSADSDTSAINTYYRKIMKLCVTMNLRKHMQLSKAVFLNRRAAARGQPLASILPVPRLIKKKKNLPSRGLTEIHKHCSKGFRRWCITLRITGFSDFAQRPVF